MRYIYFVILGFVLMTACSEEEVIIPTTEPEFRYSLPQGDHDYDSRIVDWFERCGFYILYKFEPKDVYFNLGYGWQGPLLDTIVDQYGNQEFTAKGYSVEMPNEAYVEEQLTWIEEMFLNHYSDEVLRNCMPMKVILGKNVFSYFSATFKMNYDYVTYIFNEIIFSYGDESIQTLSNSKKNDIKIDVNDWFLTQRMIDHLPDLDAFYASVDYDRVLTSSSRTERATLGYLSSSTSSSIDEMQGYDREAYLEMIISYSYDYLTQEPTDGAFTGYNYAGILHPKKDVSGLIRARYDLIVNAYKEHGVDLQAIGNLYQ